MYASSTAVNYGLMTTRYTMLLQLYVEPNSWIKHSALVFSFYTALARMPSGIPFVLVVLETISMCIWL